MSKRFLDKVLGFMGIQEEAEEERDEWDAQQPARPQPQEQPEHDRRRNRLVSLPGQKTAAKMSVVVIEPRNFDEVQEIAGYLKNRRPVILSLESVEREMAKRIVDFVSGTTYGLDGHMQRLAEAIFLFTPSNVDIDIDKELQEKGRQISSS